MTDPYFAAATDATGAGEYAALLRQNCKITPLIDTADYNAALIKQLDAMTSGANGETILIANWWLGLRGGRRFAFTDTPEFGGSTGTSLVDSAPYTIDAPPAARGTRVLADELKAKARAGVDVRVMAWASPALSSIRSVQKNAGNLPLINSASMLSVQDLRGEPAIGSKAILNIATHPGGAAHLKMAVFASNSSAVGFTGGIDFESGRWAHANHPGDETWHNAVAQVEGPAVQDLYIWFCQVWQQNLAIPPVAFVFNEAGIESRIAWPTAGLSLTPPLDPGRQMAAGSPGNHTAQVLRTVPKFDLSLMDPNPGQFAGFDGYPDGCFEVEVAWRKAISQASQYVYIEDQSFSSADVMRWLNAALKRSPDLKVILMRPGLDDPNDTPDPATAGLLHQSLNLALLDGLGAADMDRIRLFERYGDTIGTESLNITAVAPAGDGSVKITTDWSPAGNRDAAQLRGYQLLSGANRFPVMDNEAYTAGTGTVILSVSRLLNRMPVAGAATLEQRYGITVHAKTTIVDDHWAVIGSANCMRRSLYTDLECSVGFADTGPGTSVRDYRALLWSQHFQLPSPAPINDLPTALKVWSDSWGPAGPSAIVRPGTVQEILLPFPRRSCRRSRRRRSTRSRTRTRGRRGDTWDWPGITGERRAAAGDRRDDLGPAGTAGRDEQDPRAARRCRKQPGQKTSAAGRDRMGSERCDRG